MGININLTDIDIGSAPGDKTGDPGRTAFSTINNNNAIIEAAIEDASIKGFTISCCDEEQTIEERLALLTTDILRTTRMPYALVLTEVRANVNAADSGGDITLDLLENGVSILDSGLLVIPAGSETSYGHSPAPLSELIILEDSRKIQVEHVSSPTGGAATGLEVQLIGYAIWITN